MCTEMQEALETARLSWFVDSIRGSTGMEKIIALSNAYGGLLEQAEFTAVTLRSNAAAIEGLATVLRVEVDAALESLRRPRAERA